LSTSEAGFREARIMDVQILCAKPGWRGSVSAQALPGLDSLVQAIH
jgi:hypothetical protein